jgi:hypothetical protein
MRILSAKTLAWLVIGAVWTVFVAVFGAVATELWLGSQNPDKPWRLKESEPPIMRHLRTAYHPFMVKHLHPHYLFFFPLDPKEQVKIGNEVCSIVPGGFRAAGPERAGDRKLSFIIGGSTAFGLWASSNEVTIAGHLNASQGEFFHIDTGVPSWNSTQNLFRLTNELLTHRPKRVIDFEWSNDLRLAQKHYLKGYGFPPGTPECFDQLKSAMDEIVERPEDLKRPSWHSVFFPNLTGLVARWRLAASREAGDDGTEKARFKKVKLAGRPQPALPEHVLDEVAERLAWNFRIMHQICLANGAEFFAVLHPVASMHKSCPEDWGERFVEYDRKDFPYVRDRLLALLPEDFPIIDLSACFDGRFAALPIRVRDADPKDDTIMMDSVHLSDRGNAIVAEEIARAIDALKGSSKQP